MKAIILTQGKMALVDEADFGFLLQYQWHAAQVTKGIWYATRKFRKGGKVFTEYMHALLAKTMHLPAVDHRDGDGLNNQRSNLRPATSAQNAQNRRKRRDARCSRKGITLRKSGKFEAQIKIAGRSVYLGLFDDEESAAAAYTDAAADAFGEFAKS